MWNSVSDISWSEINLIQILKHYHLGFVENPSLSQAHDYNNPQSASKSPNIL